MTIFIGTILKKLHFYFKISIEFVYFHIRLNLPLKVGVIIKQIKITGFPGEDGKESACNVGDLSSTPGLGRSPGEGNDSPVFLPGESDRQRSLAGYIPWGPKESDTTE